MKTILTIASLLVPLPIACVPFITHTYGLAGAWCWIKATDADCSKSEAGVIEQFTLWYGPLCDHSGNHYCHYLQPMQEGLELWQRELWSTTAKTEPEGCTQRGTSPDRLPHHLHTLCWIPLADQLQTAKQSRLFALGLAQAIASPTLDMIASTTLLIHLQVLSFTECEVSHEK